MVQFGSNLKILAVLGAFGIIAMPGPSALAEESYECRLDGRLMSDDELLDIAFRDETGRLTDDWIALGLSGLREANPNCCFVQRADNPFTQERDWLSRLLSEPSIFVTIKWDLDPMNLGAPTTSYFITLCGDVFERHGTPESRSSRGN